VTPFLWPGEPNAGFLHAASTTLWDVSREDPPGALGYNEDGRLTCRRLLELAAEHCDAVEELRRASLMRPAHSVLRSLLETLTVLAWIARRPQRHLDLFHTNELPPVRNLLETLGWDSEFELTYKPLSEFTHPRATQLHVYRQADTGLATGMPAPEITADGELYVLPDEVGIPFVSFTPMTSQEAEELYAPYLRFKALDIVLTAVLKLWGSDVVAAGWWPAEAATALADLLDERGDVRELALASPAALRGQGTLL
jgi:hypothetical protein